MFDDIRSSAVLIAAAGSEIGQALALAFGEAGARLLVADPDPRAAAETARLVNFLGGEAVSAPLDPGDPAQLVDHVRTELGGLDALVAAGNGDPQKLVRTGLPLLADADPGAAVIVEQAPGELATLAREAAASRVRVNGVFSLPEGALGALGRELRLNDITGAALFLASQASAFITGQTIVVDGGASLLQDGLQN